MQSALPPYYWLTEHHPSDWYRPDFARRQLIHTAISRLYPFTSKRFHVLLNSLFKVLFNFPSRYLFAIGLVVIFSLRWNLPPTLDCTLKQSDSDLSTIDDDLSVTGLSPSMESQSRDLTDLASSPNTLRHTLHFSTPPRTKRFSAGLFPFHSPLLREYYLVSFPPLTNMLKFSGYSRLS